MTDIRLLAIKHGRIAIPLIVLIALLRVARLGFDALPVQQVTGIGVMLLSVALTLYALDAVLRLTGLGDDRLLLLSPMSRWRLAVTHAAVLGTYLLLGYLPAPFTDGQPPSADVAYRLADVTGHVVSVFTGLGLMLSIAYALKPIRRRFVFILASWLAYAVVVTAVTVGCLYAIDRVSPDSQWLIGVTASDSAVTVHAAILPITAMGSTASTATVLAFAACNLFLGCLLWATAGVLSHRRNNFLTLH